MARAPKAAATVAPAVEETAVEAAAAETPEVVAEAAPETSTPEVTPETPAVEETVRNAREVTQVDSATVRYDY